MDLFGCVRNQRTGFLRAAKVPPLWVSFLSVTRCKCSWVLSGSRRGVDLFSAELGNESERKGTTATRSCGWHFSLGGFFCVVFSFGG